MITILIPTINRADRIERIAKNIRETTKNRYNIYFLYESTDQDTQRAILKFEENEKAVGLYSNQGGSYVSAINNAYKRMVPLPDVLHEYIFLGSDDIEFTPGWDELMIDKFKDEKIGVVGHRDNWPISKTGKHGSHLMIRKKYIQEQSGVEDERDVVYSSQYKHYMCDIETEQTAMKRGAFAMSEAQIMHHHWVNGEAKMDETYIYGQRDLERDKVTFSNRRKFFEQYLFEELYHGKIVSVNKKKLSIVIGSYNAPDALKETLDSLIANTYHDFELIIVDDVSTNERTKEIIRELQYKDVKRFFLHDHIYTTGVWNYGVARAKGDVIVVSNNDITFSKNWDVYLMEALDDENVYLANPYQTDDGEHTSYGVAERAGGINIRGTCFAMSKESAAVLFPLPKNLVMWFSDFWIAWRIEQLKKKSIFIERSVVHNLGSKSSKDIQKETGLLWWIIRGDALQFEKMTGIDTTHWLSVAEAQLPYGNK